MSKITPRSGDSSPATPKRPKPTPIADLLHDADCTGYLTIASNRWNHYADQWMDGCKQRRGWSLVILTGNKRSAVELDLRPAGVKLAPAMLSLVSALLSEHASESPFANDQRTMFRASVDPEHAEFVAGRLVVLLERCEARP